MNQQDKIGIYLFQKNSREQLVLRDLILIYKINSPKKNLLFSYVEASASLHGELTLWENLQLVTGASNWREFCQITSKEILSLLDLIKNTDRLTKDCGSKEKFIISLILGTYQKETLLIDINEDLLDFQMIKILKELFLKPNQKQIFLASANTGLWIDCAHTLISKEANKLKTHQLNTEIIKKNEAA